MYHIASKLTSSFVADDVLAEMLMARHPVPRKAPLIFMPADYAGDSFDNESDCYWFDSGQLVALGNGMFRDSYDNSTCSIEACDNSLIINCDGESNTYYATTKSSFVPICQ